MIKWFTPVLALGVAIFIIFFLISINPSQEPKQIWLTHFSKTQKLRYFYPVNEASIEVDLDKKIVSIFTYKLSASLLDPYQLFCLKEELRQHKLRYYLNQNKSSSELLVYSKRIEKLSSLVRVL